MEPNFYADKDDPVFLEDELVRLESLRSRVMGTPAAYLVRLIDERLVDCRDRLQDLTLPAGPA